MLHDAVGDGVYGSVEISVTKVYGPTLLALQGGGVGGLSNFQKKALRNT